MSNYGIWIPVTDQLPNQNDDVLMTWLEIDENGEIYRRVSQGFYNEEEKWFEDGNYQYYLVIAWMPLPKPYEGKV